MTARLLGGATDGHLADVHLVLTKYCADATNDARNVSMRKE